MDTTLLEHISPIELSVYFYSNLGATLISICSKKTSYIGSFFFNLNLCQGGEHFLKGLKNKLTSGSSLQSGDMIYFILIRIKVNILVILRSGIRVKELLSLRSGLLLDPDEVTPP